MIYEAIMLDDKINSTLCGGEMSSCNDVLMFSTAVMLTTIPCLIFQRKL